MQFQTSVGGDEYVLEADVLDWHERCLLYRNGVQIAKATSPAQFDLDVLSPHSDATGATIEAQIGWYGMRRAHVVTRSGEHELSPVRGTWEHARARFAKRMTGLYWFVAILAAVVLLAVIAVEGMQSLQWVTRSEWFAGLSDWRFTSPVNLPLPANILITLAGVAALVELIFRSRHRWLLNE